MSLIRINSSYLKLWGEMSNAEQAAVKQELTEGNDWAVGSVCYIEEVDFLREYYAKQVEGFGGLKAFPVLVKVQNDPDTWQAGWMEAAMFGNDKAAIYSDDGDYAIMRCPVFQKDQFAPGFSLLAEDADGKLRDPLFEASIISTIDQIAAKIKQQ